MQPLRYNDEDPFMTKLRNSSFQNVGSFFSSKGKSVLHTNVSMITVFFGALFNATFGVLIPFFSPGFLIALFTYFLPLFIMRYVTYKDEENPWKKSSIMALIPYATVGFLLHLLLTYKALKIIKNPISLL